MPGLGPGIHDFEAMCSKKVAGGGLVKILVLRDGGFAASSA